MITLEDTIGVCNFKFTMDNLVIDPMSVNMYNEVTTWLLPVIEEVFNKPMFREYHMIIDTLQINLGEIVCSEKSLREVKEPLKKMLEDELYKKIQSGNTSGESVQIIPVKQAEVDLLMEFLKYGFFKYKIPVSFDRLLEAIIDNDISMFIMKLKANAGIENVLKRLVWQFETSLIEKVLMAVEPSESTFISQYIDSVKTSGTSLSQQSSAPLDSDALRFQRQIYEFTMEYLLVEKSIQFNRTEFVHAIILRISNHYNIGFVTLLHALICVVDNTASNTQEKHELRKILEEIKQNRIDNKRDDRASQVSFDVIAAQFLEILQSSKNSQDVYHYWDRMVLVNRDKTRDMLLIICRNYGIAHRLVHSLDNDRLNECIEIISSRANEFIRCLTGTLVDIVLKIFSGRHKSNENTAGYGKLVKEWCIQYIIQHNGESFTEKNIMYSITCRIADRFGVNKVYCIETLIANLQCRTDTSHEKKQIYQLLSDVQREQGLYTLTTETRNSKNITNEIVILELFEQLRAFLFYGICKSASVVIESTYDIEMAIKKIYDHRKDLLIRLYNEMSTDVAIIEKIIALHGWRCIELLDRYHTKTDDYYLQNKHIGHSATSHSSANGVNAGTSEWNIILLRLKNKVSDYLQRPRNPCKLTIQDLSQMEPTVLLDYLEYFLIHPSCNHTHGISREQLLDVVLAKYPEEFTARVNNISITNADLFMYNRYSNFLIRPASCELLSGLKNRTLYGKPAGELLCEFQKLLHLKCIQMMQLLAAVKDQCFNDHDNIIVDFIVNYSRERLVSNNSEVRTDAQIQVCFEVLTDGKYKSIATGSNEEHKNKLNDWYKQNSTSQLSSGKNDREYYNVRNDESNSLEQGKNQYKSNTIESLIQRLITYIDIENDSGRVTGTLIRELFFKTIVETPDELIRILQIRNDACNIIEKLVRYMPESLFFRFLHAVDGCYGIRAYRYFTVIQELLVRKYSGEKLNLMIDKLMISVAELLLIGDSICTDDYEMYSGIIESFTKELSDNEKDTVTSLMDDWWKLHRKNSVDHNDKNSSTGGVNCELTNTINKTADRALRDSYIAKTITASDIDEVSLYDEIPVENAGIVIGAPYFERLFSVCGLLDEKKFKSYQAQQKGMRMLHYFARASGTCYEHAMVINKILCGCDIKNIIDYETSLTEKEQETIDSLTDAILKNWPVMKNTSPAGLRETFLQRDGLLKRNGDDWNLTIDKKCFDMLIDSLPWSFSMIRYPWMNGLLCVEWKHS